MSQCTYLQLISDISWGFFWQAVADMELYHDALENSDHFGMFCAGNEL